MVLSAPHHSLNSWFSGCDCQVRDTVTSWLGRYWHEELEVGIRRERSGYDGYEVRWVRYLWFHNVSHVSHSHLSLAMYWRYCSWGLLDRPDQVQRLGMCSTMRPSVLCRSSAICGPFWQVSTHLVLWHLNPFPVQGLSNVKIQNLMNITYEPSTANLIS